MVDSANSVDPAPAPAPDPSAPKKPGFLSTRNGKIIVGAIAVFVLLVVIGVLVFIFVIGGLFNQAANQPAVHSSKSATVNGSPNTTSTAAAAAPIVNPPEKPISNTFTFRNIFAPTVFPPAASTTATSSSSSSSSSSSASSTTIPTEKDTLFLMSISTVNGQKQAVFAWNGVLYTCTNGQQVDDSPWKVVTISSNSVLMLFGDTQMTITLGQGVTK